MRQRAISCRLPAVLLVGMLAACGDAPVTRACYARSGICPDAERPWRGVVQAYSTAQGTAVSWRVDGVLLAMPPYLQNTIEVDTRALPDGEHTVEVDMDVGADVTERHTLVFRSENGPAVVPRFTGALEDVTERSGLGGLRDDWAVAGPSVFSPGAVAADFDGDGDQDVFAWTASGGQMMVQDALWSFRAVGEVVPGVGAAGAGDLDNDGDPDLVVAGSVVRVFRNDAGQLVDVTADTGFVPPEQGDYTGVALADLDLDGLLDVALAQMSCRGAPNALLRNEGAFHFADVADALGLRSPDGATYAFAFDRLPGRDEIEAAAFREGCTPVSSTFGVLDGSFEPPRMRAVWTTRSSPMGSAYFDAEGDGTLDILLSGNYSNWLYRYPDLNWSVAHYVGLDGFLGPAGGPVTGWAIVLFDADMDGRGDVFLVHDWLNPGDVPSHALFWHRAPGAMAEVAAAAGITGEHGCHAAHGADLDGDGDTDILLGCRVEGVRVLRNDLTAPGPGRTVVLRGTVSNADGVHAVLTSPSGEVRLSRGSGQPYAGGVVHESLRAPAGEVRVEWPSGIVQSAPAGAAGVLRIMEPAGLSVSPRRVALGGASVDVTVDPSAWRRGGADVTVVPSAGEWLVPPARGTDGVFRGTLRAPPEAGATVVLRVRVGDFAVPIHPRVFVR